MNKRRGQVGPLTFVFWCLAIIIAAAMLPVVQAVVDSTSGQFSAGDPTRTITSLAPLFLIGGVMAYLVASYTGSPSQPGV